jgi:hypothetical protein
VRVDFGSPRQVAWEVEPKGPSCRPAISLLAPEVSASALQRAGQTTHYASLSESKECERRDHGQGGEDQAAGGLAERVTPPMTSRNRRGAVNMCAARAVGVTPCALGGGARYRHEHIERDEREEQVRTGKSESSFRIRPSTRELRHHPSYGSPSLHQMHHDQSDENESDVGMNCVANVQDGQRGERARSRQ